MKVAVIENRLKDYVIDIFNRHQDTEIELINFLEWKPNQEQYQGISIGKIEELYNGQFDIILVAIKENRYLSRLLTYLHKRHIQNVYIVRLFALDMQEDFLDETQSMYLHGIKVDCMPKENEKPYLVHLETHVCDHCNLNCKACNNFSPFVKEPSYADIGQFESDLKRLAELFSGIGRFFLLGGEPLLAPELCCDMIRCYRKYFPVNELRVLTNATLILTMKDEFWDCVRENDVIIHISLYPPVKERIGEIRERLESRKVKYIVFKEVETFAKRLTLYPFEDEKFNNEHCGSAGCHYLRDGEISKCPDAILVDFMVDGNAELKSLGLNDRESLLKVNNAWELIEKIDSPVDLCKKCTYKRLEKIKWECVDDKAQSADWLLPHRYEAEIDKLKCENKILDSERESLKSELDILSKKNEKQCEEILSYKKISLQEQKTEELCNKLKKELTAWEEKLNDMNNSFRQMQQEYERISNSYSNRIGAVITWIPRKARRIVKILRKEIVQRFKESGIYKINRIFKEEILAGYKKYINLYSKFFDKEIFLQYYNGTGDVYLSAAYLKYNEMNKMIDKSVLLLTSTSAIKIAELLIFTKCELVMLEERDAMQLVALMGFIGVDKILITTLHYMSVSSYINFNIFLSGLNGINFMDLYQQIVYRKIDVSLPKLVWVNDDTWLLEVVKNNELINLQTILIAPVAYSAGKRKLPMSFWEVLVDRLKAEGYVVCTNVVNKNDKPILGSKGIFIPYKHLGSFLEFCGYFIGYRSGLCDLVANVKCKKIIIYPNNLWPHQGGTHSAIEIFSLKAMGISDDVTEIEYNECEKDMITKIVKICKA